MDERPFPDQLNLVVGDMEATVAFYRRLGLRIDDAGPEWDPHHRSATVEQGLDFDLDSITFASQWDRGWTGGPGTLITFRLPSRDAVDRVFADLVAAGHPAQQAPYDAFWGARFAVVEDPDGRTIGLMSPADEAHRKPGPDAPS